MTAPNRLWTRSLGPLLLAGLSLLNSPAFADDLTPAVAAIQQGRPQLAVDALLKLPARTTSMHYVLAVAYSKLGDVRKTFEHALASLDGSPPLAAPLTVGAKALLQWAVIELDRPVIRARFELSVPTVRRREMAAAAALEAQRKADAAYFADLRSRTGRHIDVRNALLVAELSDPCWGLSDDGNAGSPRDEDACRRALIEEIKTGNSDRPDYSPPKVALP